MLGVGWLYMLENKAETHRLHSFIVRVLKVAAVLVPPC